MTATETPTPTTLTTPEPSAPTRRRPLGYVLVAVVALLVGGIAGWLIRGSDGDAASSAPDGVEELLDDFVESFENKDEAAFRATVTDTFTLTEFVNQEIGDYLNLMNWTETLEQSARAVAIETAQSTPWQVDHADEFIVTGEGPWYVSRQETWDRSSGLTSDGMATYVIVTDSAGDLRIAAYYYVGLEL